MSKKPLLPVEQVLHQLVLAAAAVAGTQTLPLSQCLQRVLAEDIHAPLNVPAFDNSAMDGYALAAADAGDAALPVTQRIAAGHVGQPLQAGSVARIFTGAPIPPGADAVIMQEQCELQADGRVLLRAPLQAGQNIRRCGEDMAAGSLVLAAGTRLRPQELGLLASLGMACLSVRAQPRVAVFFTGDELVEPGQPLGSGQIYNSNRYMVVALLQQLGCSVSDLGTVADSLEATRAALRQAASQHDLVLTCGGVSVGEEDHVKAAVEAEGELHVWQLAIKPGKPLAFGRVGQAHFVGLPGNPVSSFVTFRMLVEPFIRALAGELVRSRLVYVKAGFAWPKPDRRREYLRVQLQSGDGETVALPYAHQGSGVLTSCSFADALVEIAPEQVVHYGDVLPCHLL